MLILMKPAHSARDLERLCEAIQKLGYSPHVIPGQANVAVGITGNRAPLDRELFIQMEGVQDAIPVTKSYKLASRSFHNKDLEIKVGPVTFGPNRCVLMAGPCAVESEEQTLRIAHAVKSAGAHVLRGGAFKPRSSPYSFQGLGREGLKILQRAGRETGLPTITEALDEKSLELVYEYADIIQIGTRNMQNFTLLQQAGRLDKPVMLKRGMSATIDEWLAAAEYILEQGNSRVLLCERGLRSFDPATRNMLDIAAVPVIKSVSPLPVVVDPSHGTGRKDLIVPMSRAAVVAGASALIIDVHDRPKEALCDGPQALLPEEFKTLVLELKALAHVLHIQMD